MYIMKFLKSITILNIFEYLRIVLIWKNNLKEKLEFRF